jgi:NAD(P)-dependent dehydrogenase (short-subunit alcohol dehydrogenase family)
MNEGQVVLISGGAKRIGRALAVHLAHQGFRVVVHYHTSESEARQLQAEFEAEGLALKLVRGDLSVSSQLDSLFRTAISAYGQVDHLINNASFFPSQTIEDTDLLSFENLMAVHNTAPFFLSKALYTHLLSRSAKGSVINILDTKLSSPTASRPAYYCAKGALSAQTKALAVALGPVVRVNAISPGPILSNGEETYFRKMEELLPTRATGSVQDICEAVSYLLGASFVTGVDLPVDGGQRLL